MKNTRMHNHHLEFLPTAAEDLDRIADFYLVKAGAVYAKRITDQILRDLQQLESYPYLGSLHPDPVLASMEYRRIVSGEYICVYKVFDQAVIVYRIVRGSTDYKKYFYL